MPGFDRSGPGGMGPGTGRGMGYCNSPADRGWGGGRGFRGARGGGVGRGMAYRHGRGGYPVPVDYYGAYSYDEIYPREDEAKMLREEVAFMEKRMKELNSRLSELESSEGEKGDKRPE